MAFHSHWIFKSFFKAHHYLFFPLCLLYWSESSVTYHWLYFFFSLNLFLCKPLYQGLTLDRWLRGSCSAAYEALIQKQVIHERFSARFPTNMWWVKLGAAAFPAAPHILGGGALCTRPWSPRMAGDTGGDHGGPAFQDQLRPQGAALAFFPGRVLTLALLLM